MDVLTSTEPYSTTVLLWLARTAFFALLSVILLLLGIWIIDVLTPTIAERTKIGESPIATGLFIGGCFVFIGLVIHGASAIPSIIGTSVLVTIFNPVRIGLLVAGFLLSLLVATAFIYIVDRLMPKITFSIVNNKPEAIGIYVFGYLTFFGLILHAALTTPL